MPANGSGVYEVGAFKAQKFIPPPKQNNSTKAECLVVSPNFINTLLAVVAVFQGQILNNGRFIQKTWRNNEA